MSTGLRERKSAWKLVAQWEARIRNFASEIRELMADYELEGLVSLVEETILCGLRGVETKPEEFGDLSGIQTQKHLKRKQNPVTGQAALPAVAVTSRRGDNTRPGPNGRRAGGWMSRPPTGQYPYIYVRNPPPCSQHFGIGCSEGSCREERYHNVYGLRRCRNGHHSNERYRAGQRGNRREGRE